MPVCGCANFSNTVRASNEGGNGSFMKLLITMGFVAVWFYLQELNMRSKSCKSVSVNRCAPTNFNGPVSARSCASCCLANVILPSRCAAPSDNAALLTLVSFAAMSSYAALTPAKPRTLLDNTSTHLWSDVCACWQNMLKAFFNSCSQKHSAPVNRSGRLPQLTNHVLHVQLVPAAAVKRALD